MTQLRRYSIVCMTILSVAASAWSTELFVDQKNPKADDKNPGTEALPFKTIQPAINAAKSADIIQVKAGVYSDLVHIKGYGRPTHPNTLTAWKNDRVVIGSELRDLPAPDQWKPIDGHKSYQVQMPEGTPQDLIVILEGRPIVTQRKDVPPADDTLNWATYRTSDRTLMVNTGDGNPAAIHKLGFARRIEPFSVSDEAGYWKICKLEFAWLNTGIGMNGTGILLEDCYFHNIYRPAIFCTGRLGIIRRCNFYHCGYCIAGQQGPGSIIEDCMMIQCGQDPNEDVDSRVNNDGEGGGPISCKGGPVTGGIFRYNIVADSTAGIWWDCGGTGLRIIGNGFWSNRGGSGIYNEWGINDTLIIGNYFYRTAMGSSWSTRMTVTDNFFDNIRGGGVSWANRDPWPLRFSFMTLRGNAFTGIHMAYIGGENRGQDGVWPEGFATAFADYNKARINPDAGVLMHGATTRIKTLEELQNKFGWELHSDVKKCEPKDNDLTPESMGGSTVTFRLPWGPRAHLARPMLADAKIDGRWPAAPEYAGGRFPGFYWRVADGDCSECPFNDNFPDITYDKLWHPECSAGYDIGVNHGATWYVGADDKYVDPKMNIDKPSNRGEWSAGNRWLTMIGTKPEAMPASGACWWTPWMGACPGAKTTVSFKMYGKNVEATEKATPVVYMQFIDATGRSMTRAYIVGKGEDGKVNHPELTKGTFDWTQITETITAPESAVRMALALGVLPCKGEVGFDDINLKTADGDKPAGESEIVEAKPAVIPKERMREIIYVDLSKVANRSLADEVAGDGKGGWTDQGPDLDMRKLPTGEMSLGGVPFRIANGPKSVVAVQANPKPGTDVVKEVTIPLGPKMEAMYVLQAGAFLTDNKKLCFEVVVKYKDGTTSSCQCWPFPNAVVDWQAEPVRDFGEHADNPFTTAALTVKVGAKGKGTIYRTEHILDRAKHDVPVESITIRGGENGLGLILAITGVTQW